MMKHLINRYKRLRTEQYLARTYQNAYTFVGMGQHALSNLYPVLHYLGVPLKYVCVRSKKKTRLIERKFPQLIATTSLDDILGDDTVKGVFVSASPSTHFLLASRILQSGKSLFIEKPPCQSLQELDTLIGKQRLYGSPVAMAGLQKRYAPAIQILQKRLRRESLISYDLHYLTGNYPEGDALFELFIHPLDLVTHLFGKPEIISCQRVGSASFLLMLRHPHIAGTLELSTAYSWTAAEESLKICTSKGIYRLSQMDELTFEPTYSTILGIPSEKVSHWNKRVEYLYVRNNFTPIPSNNQIFSQGYFTEIQTFVNAVEGHKNLMLSSLEAIKDTYLLLEAILVYSF